MFKRATRESRVFSRGATRTSPPQIIGGSVRRRLADENPAIDASLAMVWAEINLGALRRNLRSVRSRLKRGCKVLAVVKADAYGHGMRAVALALAREGVRFFGVANADEAAELRKSLKTEAILVLGNFHPSQIPLYLRHRLIPTISSVDDLLDFEKACKKKSLRRPAHLKVDTGMGRQGVWYAEAKALFQAASRCRFAFVDGIYTHFANADHRKKTFTERQIRRFRSTIRDLSVYGIRPRYFHAANSMGLVRFDKAHFNLVRPGIMLYGIHPFSGNPKDLRLQPVLSLKTRVAFLKKVKKGRTISYGGAWRAPKDTWVAVLPVGYSHGYRVGFSNKAFVSIRGVACPVVGRVTMDQTLVDVGKVPLIKRWEEVTLIGNGNRLLSAESLAELAGTIPYEIVCSIHPRIHRIYKS